jgi:hypothetical protein
MPGRKSSAAASHSLSHSALAAPLTLARTHSGWYLPERGNRSETDGLSKVMQILLLAPLVRAGVHETARGDSGTVGAAALVYRRNRNDLCNVPQPFQPQVTAKK